MGKKQARRREAKKKNQDQELQAQQRAAAQARHSMIVKGIAVVGVVAGIAAGFLVSWETGGIVIGVGIIGAMAYDSFIDPPESRGGGSSDAINFGN